MVNHGKVETYTKVDWDEINSYFQSTTVLHRCDNCGEFKHLDLIQSLVQMKQICLKCVEKDDVNNDCS